MRKNCPVVAPKRTFSLQSDFPASSTRAANRTGTSFNGRTPASGAGYWGSNPCVPANFSATSQVLRPATSCGGRFFVAQSVRLADQRQSVAATPAISTSCRESSEFESRKGSSCRCPQIPNQRRRTDPRCPTRRLGVFGSAERAIITSVDLMTAIASSPRRRVSDFTASAVITAVSH